MQIRPLELKDRDRWSELFDAYAMFYKTSVTDEAKQSVWDWVFDEAEQFWCDVAVGDDGKLIGFTQYQLMHRSLSGGMVMYLSDLFADPEYRGKGVGRALIDRVFDATRDMNVDAVRWLTQDYNYKARALYDTYKQKTDFVLYAVPVEQA